MKTHCRRGHEFTPENTLVRCRGFWKRTRSGVVRVERTTRECRACHRDAVRKRYAEVHGPVIRKARCPAGHLYAETEVMRASGFRMCSQCHAARAEQAVAVLKPAYVAGLLGLPVDRVPAALIELKRTEVQFARAAKAYAEKFNQPFPPRRTA